MDIAIGCGYDTDCTAATAGAILNAMQGSDALPDSVREAVADTYLVSPWMHGFPSSGSLKELTRSCCRFGREVVAAFGEGRGILADDSGNGTESRPLAVVAQEVPPIDPVDKPFPDWIVLGPFFRDWTEIVAQHEVYPDHALPELPSTRYMTLMHSGFDLEVLDAAAVTTSGLLPEDRTGALVRTIRAVDSRLDLHRGIESNGPGTFYAYSEFDSPDAGRNWLLLGSTGPVEVWINGACILKSDTFQPLAPTTLEAEITLLSGLNRIMLKLERASQPVEAFVQFKVHADRHWHQCFLNTALNWRELVE
jgi:hypothetical protein